MEGNNMHATLISLLHAVFSAEAAPSNRNLSLPGGPLEAILQAIDCMEIEASKLSAQQPTSIAAARKLASTNQLCALTLEWARERVRFMKETCSTTTRWRRSGSLECLGKYMLIRIEGVIEEVLVKEVVEVGGFLKEVRDAEEMGRLVRAMVRELVAARVGVGDLESAMRACGWCALCAKVVRWALNQVTCMLVSSSGSTMVACREVEEKEEKEEEDEDEDEDYVFV